jgi:hypothetical protein
MVCREGKGAAMPTPALDTQPRDLFLAHFPVAKRGPIANWFLRPIREHGAHNPHVVVAGVLALLQTRLEQPWASHQARSDAELAQSVIRAHRDDALQCATYYIAYERLPDDAKAALKRDQRAAGQHAWMAEKPPTAKQIGYLRTLGYAEAPPPSMLQASELIDRLLADRGTQVAR